MRRATTLPAEAASVQEARAFVTSALAAVPCTPSTIEVAQLLVSELATNAVVHSHSARLTVEVAVDRHCARVAVHDDDPGGLPGVAEGDPPDGRRHGLQLVEELATRWWWQEHDDSPGKTVTFEVPCT